MPRFADYLPLRKQRRASRPRAAASYAVIGVASHRQRGLAIVAEIGFNAFAERRDIIGFATFSTGGIGFALTMISHWLPN